MRYQYFEYESGNRGKHRWRQWGLAGLILIVLIVVGIWIGKLIPGTAKTSEAGAFYEGYYTINTILDRSLQQRFPGLTTDELELYPGGQSIHTYRLPAKTTLTPNDVQQAIGNTLRGYGFTIQRTSIQPVEWHFKVEKDTTVWADLIFKFTVTPTAGLTLPLGLNPGRGHPKIAIIIDDFGYSYNQTIQGFVTLKDPLSYSIIPEKPYSRRTAQALHNRNKIILIHMPLVTVNGTSSEPGIVLTPDLTDEEIDNRLQRAYKSVPFAMGLNNHQGSGGTQDADLMSTVMRWVKEKHLWFVDSRTIAATVAEKTARKMGIPTTRRNIFLDDVDDVDAIKKELIHLAKLSQKHGYAVAIGHCRPNTLTALRSYLPLLKSAGYDLVPVADLVN